MSMPGPPHIEPPRCPGHSSTSAGSVSSRSRRERKMPRAPSAFSIARSGRATSLTNRLSPVSTAHGASPRRVSTSANAVCSGRWPGVWSARMRSAPSANSAPSSNGSWSYSGAASRWMWIVAPVAAARRPWPGHVVGVVVGLEDVLDAEAHVARQLEVLVDLEARVDDRGDSGLLVADQVRRAAEVVVGDLAEDHGPIVRAATPKRWVLSGYSRAPVAEYLTHDAVPRPPQAGAPDPDVQLEHCAMCHEDFVNPVDWEPVGEDRWWMLLRCGACDTWRDLTTTNAVAAALRPRARPPARHRRPDPAAARQPPHGGRRRDDDPGPAPRARRRRRLRPLSFARAFAAARCREPPLPAG